MMQLENITKKSLIQWASSITKDEILTPAKQLKNKKAVGEDKIPTEIIKIFIEEHIDMTQDLFNRVYNTGKNLMIG